jgi:hypothetical protein
MRGTDELIEGANKSMIERKARTLTLFALIGSMILGSLIVICGSVLIPTYTAASIDVILTQEELQDPKLVEMVYRTHWENAQRYPFLVWPYQVMGMMIVGLSAAGTIGLRRWQLYQRTH